MNEKDALKEKGLLLDILMAYHRIDDAQKSLEDDPASAEDVATYVEAKRARLTALRQALYDFYSQFDPEKQI